MLACNSNASAPNTEASFSAEAQKPAAKKEADTQPKEYVTFAADNPNQAMVGGELKGVEDSKVYWIKLKQGQPLFVMGGDNVNLILTDPAGNEVANTSNKCHCFVKLSNATAGAYKVKVELCKKAKEHYGGIFNLAFLLEEPLDPQSECQG